MANNQLIGEKISAVRAFRKIELQHLADKTGLSVEQLNLIESGKSIPSLGVLIRIARALGTRIGTLLDDMVTEGPVVVRSGEQQESSSFSTSQKDTREHLTFFSLAPNMTGRHMEPFIVEIVPDAKNQPVMSSHEGEEFLYVLEGSIMVHYGNDVITLEKGDSMYLDSIVKHLVTTNEKKARILGIVYVPV